MNFVRKIILSNRLEEIIEIPENLKNREVEILVLPTGPFDIQSPLDVRPKNAGGFLERYKNIELISIENSAEFSLCNPEDGSVKILL